MELQQVSKKAIWNMLAGSLIWGLLLLAVLAFVWIQILSPETPVPALAIVYWCCVGLLEAAFLISPFIRWHRYRYQIDETRIVKREGLIFISTEIAPIERVHQISVLRGPIDRLTGLGKVKATTAGGEIVIRFLEQETAEALVGKLERQIKQIVRRQGDSQC